MTASYRIVWIDDSTDWVESVRGDIEGYLEDLGYEPDVTFKTDGEDIDNLTRSDVDLFLVDYNLPGKNNGDLLIQRIRESGTFTEVVFYSQDADPKSVIGPTEGIFFSPRDDAIDKFKRVIDLTLHKLKDVAVVRGLIIASAIDLEVIIEELLVGLFRDGGVLFKSRVIERGWLDASRKTKLLLGVVKDCAAHIKDSPEDLEIIREVQTLLRLFEREVLDQRNILAHSRVQMVGGKQVLKGLNRETKIIEFNSEWLANLRRTLHRHKLNLEKLRDNVALLDVQKLADVAEETGD